MGLNREEKIKFCIESAQTFGEEKRIEEIPKMTDEALAKLVDWYDYLWDK